jgi:hypothetical protein
MASLLLFPAAIHGFALAEATGGQMSDNWWAVSLGSRYASNAALMGVAAATPRKAGRRPGRSLQALGLSNSVFASWPFRSDLYGRGGVIIWRHRQRREARERANCRVMAAHFYV